MMDIQTYRRIKTEVAASSAPGQVSLPTGQVVVCDPFFCAQALALNFDAEPGRYDVLVGRTSDPVWGPRIVFVEIVFAHAQPATGIAPAKTLGGSDGFFVDSGLACLMDIEVGTAFAGALDVFYAANPNGNYYSDVLSPLFRPLDESGEATTRQDYVTHKISPELPPAHIFSSGDGDGFYRTYLTTGADGAPVSLVVDFRRT